MTISVIIMYPYYIIKTMYIHHTKTIFSVIKITSMQTFSLKKLHHII